MDMLLIGFMLQTKIKSKYSIQKYMNRALNNKALVITVIQNLLFICTGMIQHMMDFTTENMMNRMIKDIFPRLIGQDTFIIMGIMAGQICGTLIMSFQPQITVDIMEG